MANFCSKCGKKVTQKQAFCLYCGTKLRKNTADLRPKQNTKPFPSAGQTVPPKEKAEEMQTQERLTAPNLQANNQTTLNVQTPETITTEETTSSPINIEQTKQPQEVEPPASVEKMPSNALIPSEVTETLPTENKTNSKKEDTEDKTKKELTNAIIIKDLHNKRHSFWEYIGHLLMLGLMILVAVWGNPLILICAIPWTIVLIRMIVHDVKLSQLKYYLLERPCAKKDILVQDESPDAYRLWFNDRNEGYILTLIVEKDYYDATEIDEEFYVVFLSNDEYPKLCYRKSEWIRR